MVSKFSAAVRGLSAVLACIFGWISPADAQPGANDVFREYRMSTHMYRVGQRHEWGGANWGQNLVFKPAREDADDAAYQVDLEGAIRAEVTVGFDLCHRGSSGLAVAFNDNEYLRLPTPESIPEPKVGFFHRPYPTINVPLAHLKSGGNQLKFRIDALPKPQGEGGWFQNLVYNVILRVYYDAETKPHPTGKITSISDDDVIGRKVELAVEVQPAQSPIARVDYVGVYYDFDWDGDGIYHEYQYAYNDDSRLINHIGSADKAPWQVTWDTSWVPDQKSPVQIAARITDENGITCITEALRRLRLERPGFSVELCEPYNMPEGWVTRIDGKGCNFDVTGNLANAKAAKLVFRYWGGNDDAGAILNETELPLWKSGVELPIGALKPGQNFISTKKGGHHGMEIVWPGPAVLIQYETAE